MSKYNSKTLNQKPNKHQKTSNHKKVQQIKPITQETLNMKPNKVQYNYLNTFFKQNLHPRSKQQPTKNPRQITTSENISQTLNDFNMLNFSSQINQIKQRYQILQQLLNNQNLNLKMQSQYLSNQIRKLYKKQKYYKDINKELNNKYQQLENNFNIVAVENQAIKRFMEDNINKISKEIKCLRMDGAVANLRTIVNRMCQFFQIKVEIQQEEEQQDQVETVSKFNKKVKEEEFQQKIEELNDKFQAMMYEYKNTNNSQLRKECIKIAKEIKQMKNKATKSSKQLPTCRQTIQTLSRNASKQLKILQKQLRPQTHNYSRSFDSQQNILPTSTKKTKIPLQLYIESKISRTNLVNHNSKASSSRKVQYNKY